MADIENFYGFLEHPFAMAPDPKFFFAAESQREALAAIQYGISNKKGFILLMSEAGLGKTILIQHLIGRLDRSIRAIYFPHVQMPFLQMLKDILVRLNLTPEFDTKGAMVHCLYYSLIESLGRQENVVLVCDQAEDISLELLEEVRLLANLETGTSKLLQIVLVGRPELGAKLHCDIVRQIEQRIAVHSRLHRLTEDDSKRYIEHRLKTAGNQSAVFADDAIGLICKSARGVPWAINILCSNALLLGYCLSQKKISAAVVKAIRHKKTLLREEEARALARRIKNRRVRAGIFLLSLAVFLGLALSFERSSLLSFYRSLIVHPPAAPPGSKTDAHPPAIPRTPETKRDPAALALKASENMTESTKLSPAPEPQVPSTEPDIQIKKIIEVRPGTNLSLLTLQNYKIVNETLMDHILKLNPEITNPHLLRLNQKIRLPEISGRLLIIRQAHNQYKIHLRTFGNRQDAEHYRKSAAAWAKDIEIVPWQITPQNTWYRVMTGPFTHPEAALSAVSDMQHKGFSFY